MILRSDITKMEDVLKEYQLYKKFLDRVTPQVNDEEWPSLKAFKPYYVIKTLF
jgi:hypothetical protein